MENARKNRDFSRGPVWDPRTNRWLVEIRYPDGARVRKRFRREREAIRVWSGEQAKIESGTWHEQAPKTVTFETALKHYREYSTVQNRSHHSYVEPALSVWEAHIKASTLLAKITPALIEDVKLRRAQDVAHATVDKDLAVFKAFFNWCMPRNLAAARPAAAKHGKGNKRATWLEARSTARENSDISEGKWLAALDDFRNWLIREAA
jgi:hypothetical protein